MNRYFRHIFVVALLFAAVLLPFSVPGASAATVDPNQGTIGTALTISGSGFGAKQGTVFIGPEPAQVAAWSDTQIQCLVKVPMPPETYDLKVNPQGKSPPVIMLGAFSIMPPSVYPSRTRPAFVSPGQEITLSGTFFGSGGLKKVEVENLQGEKRQCHIVDWAMDSITFQLPKGILGLFHLAVTNGVGTDFEAWWGTFAEAPNEPPPMPGAYSFGGNETYDNATAVSYQNKLWFFMPGKDTVLYYRTWDGENWTSATPLVDSGGGTHKTYAQINPVVIDNFLYLFYTRLDGDLQIVKYNPMAVDPTTMETAPVWVNIAHYGVGVYDVHGRFAAVYNYVKKYVEIYITENNTSISRLLYYPQTGSMYRSGSPEIQTDPAHPTIAPFLTAVFNGNELDNTYVTYLSWDDGYAGALTELKDNARLQQTRLWYWNSRNSLRGPSLVDLGEKYLAVIYNHFTYTASYQKYDKDQHKVIPTADQASQSNVPFTSPEQCSWAPNGIVFSTKVADSTSPTGYHMASRFYAIVEDNPKYDQANWQLVECEYLGYWKPIGPPNHVDFQGRDLSSQDAVNKRLSETFPLWSVIGLIDMPPFVRNGNPASSSAAYISDAELSFTLATTDGLSGEYSVGAYVETGKKSPVTFDVSTGYAGGFSNSRTYSYTITGGIAENLEGRIVAYYLVPSFNVYRLEWFDLNGLPTDVYIDSLEALSPSIRKEAFIPEIGPDVAYYNGQAAFTPPYLTVAKTPADIAAYPNRFPMHASQSDRDRLTTYFRNPTADSFNFVSIVDPALSLSSWGVSSPGGFEWSIDDEHSVDNGFYCNIKVGVEIAKTIGFGMEGSFKIMVNSKTQKSVKAITNLNSQDPIYPWPYAVQAVTSFNVEGYWLKPNALGYWVPNNRKGMGDSPWFITYRVTDYHP